MPQRVYTVTIFTPEGDDNYDFDVRIGRHGMEVGRFTGPMVPAAAQIGEIIMADVEGEE